MKSPLVFFDGELHAILRETEDFGVKVLDLAAPLRRLSDTRAGKWAPIRTNIDPLETNACPTPGELLAGDVEAPDTYTAMTKRSLARFEAFFLVAEDPQRRLDAKEVATLAHQVSLVRFILDPPGLKRVLIGDEVGLGKTVVAGLVIKELLEANPGLRVLYLAPARLVSNVAREFDRLQLGFRQWKTEDGDARLEDNRIVASIHRAVHPTHFEKFLTSRPFDLIVVDECHHLSAWEEDGGKPVRRYQLVRKLIDAQPPDSRLLLLSGTPHQAHTRRFENLLGLLATPGETLEAAKGRVIFRTKEDVRDWDGNPLFPSRQVNSPVVVDLGESYLAWLEAIRDHYRPNSVPTSSARRRAAGWKCAQALQWAASSPNAGLGFLVRQAIRAGWNLENLTLREGIAVLRPYRKGYADEPVEAVYNRIRGDIRKQDADADLEDMEEECESSSGGDEDESLASLLDQGIRLVRSPLQKKWEQLWTALLEPAENEKIVLFAQPIESVMALANWIEKRTGRRPSIIIGGQEDSEREKEIARFRAADGSQFLISSRAGGEGINLQWSRRLIHLDVPWNPMEMEQRVGRVHRFGSRDTVIVDTLVALNSREERAWRVARAKLDQISRTLVLDSDRSERLFSRVMSRIPPEELQDVLINSPSTLSVADERKLCELVDSGFRDWQSFNEQYGANKDLISDQPAGLAGWAQLRDFLIERGQAEVVPGLSSSRFLLKGGEVVRKDEDAEVLKLKDGSLRLVGDFAVGLHAENVQPLGLNVLPVRELLREATDSRLPTGAVHLNWRDSASALRSDLGDDAVVLVFLRQKLRTDSISRTSDAGCELLSFQVLDHGHKLLSDSQRQMLFGLHRITAMRLKPIGSHLRNRAVEAEEQLVRQLRIPTEAEIKQGIRFGVWPILALHVSS